jgi:threonine synthase
VSLPSSRLICTGCGAKPDPADPYPFRCPNADGDGDVDHVLRRRLDLYNVRFPLEDTQRNPFLRYRRLLHAYHVAVAGGMSDEEFCELVKRLDRAIAEVDGDGFVATPFARNDELSAKLGFSARGGIWVKDETHNVSGSHKARHLFSVLLQLEVADHIGLTDPGLPPELAIASCGNAALAAAVLAAAAGRVLRVFVPEDADPAVVARLGELGAKVTFCHRSPGVAGDPTYNALLEAIAAGSLPFTCQGNLNGLAVEGGETLGYEIASDLDAAHITLDRLIVQVGGGALASACFESLRDAVELGALDAMPRIDTVQTASASPLRRAYDRVRAHLNGDPFETLDYAAHHRSEFMWPWEHEPHSIAHGILDDETYDWLAVVEAMIATGGTPLVVDEARLADANDLACDSTGIDVDPTGSSGLAGLLALRDAGLIAGDERVGVLFTGINRTSTPTRKESHNEKLSGTRHLVAQGLRTR